MDMKVVVSILELGTMASLPVQRWSSFNKAVLLATLVLPALFCICFNDVSWVVFAHLELQHTRSPFSTEGAALAHISNDKVSGGGVESSLPLHRCRPRPPFTLTVIDELGRRRDRPAIKQQ